MLLFSCIFVISACFLAILLNQSLVCVHALVVCIYIYSSKRLIVDVGNGLVMCLVRWVQGEEGDEDVAESSNRGSFRSCEGVWIFHWLCCKFQNGEEVL